jgi:hypothetical protein
VGTNRRYADKIDARIAERTVGHGDSPVTLPQQAYGPRPIEWTQARPPVWVWVQWRDRAAERVRGYVKGHNDRVCIVAIEGPGGGWEIVVWRPAVSHRSTQ